MLQPVNKAGCPPCSEGDYALSRAATLASSCFDPLHCFLQRLHCLHVKHRIVDALGDGAKVIAVFVAVGGFADEARGDKFNFLGDETDLGVGLAFLEVVVTDLESFQVVPLGVGINDVLLQLDVGDGAVGVVGVSDISISQHIKELSPICCTCCRVILERELALVPAAVAVEPTIAELLLEKVSSLPSF
jgi:hypothetical protein